MKTDLSATQTVREEANVYAIIGGVPVGLPNDARYICQDVRGCWYFCNRKPRVKDNDWTPNKTPIQPHSPHGRLKASVVMTEVNPNWANTLQSTIKRAQLPMRH